MSEFYGERMDPGRRRMGFVLVLLAVLVLGFFTARKHQPAEIIPPADQSARLIVKSHLEDEQRCPLSPRFVPGVVTSGSLQEAGNK